MAHLLVGPYDEAATEAHGRLGGMPKSRGRKHARSPRRTGPTATSWQAVVLRAGRPLAQPGTARLDAELYASGMLGIVWADRELGDREIVDVWLGELLEYAAKRRTAEAAAVVAALALVLDHPALETALIDWAGELTADLPWRQAATPLPIRVTRCSDVWDDTTSWFLEYDDALLMVHTARSDAGTVADAAVLELGALSSWDREIVASHGEMKERVEVDTAEAVAAPGNVALPVPEALLKVTVVVLSVVTVLPAASLIVAVRVRLPPPAVDPEVVIVAVLAAPGTIV